MLKQRKHVQGNEIQDALSPSIAIFDLFLMKQYNISINPCFILGVDGCFTFFLHKLVVYSLFSYFQYGFQIGRQRSRDFLLLLVQMKVLYISNNL